jgi:hypothetical protein
VIRSQPRRQIRRLEAALREILGQYVNRNALGDDREDVVLNAWRLRLPSAAEDEPGCVLGANRIIDRIAAQ